MEVVAALGSGGANIPAAEALSHVYGYAAGLDMTRRDLQSAAKAKGRPWTTGKNVENSAVISAIQPATAATNADKGAIELRVNGEVRQSADMSTHIWTLPEIIADLSRFYVLQAGDLIMMGTPAGVGPVVAGDVLTGHVEKIGGFEVRFV